MPAIAMPAAPVFTFQPLDGAGAPALEDPTPRRWTPVDLSFLNAPIRAKWPGVTLEQGAFVYGKKRLKLWGANWCSPAIGSAVRPGGDGKELVRDAVKRFAALGFNWARIHHIDSNAVFAGTVFDPAADNTSTFSASFLDALDWFTFCCAESGIFWSFDILNRRALKPGDRFFQGREIPLFDELFAHPIGTGTKPGELKGYLFFDPVLPDVACDHALRLLSHVNPYRGVAHKDDPGLALVLALNEHDITTHAAGHSPTELRKLPSLTPYQRAYLDAWSEFASRTGVAKDTKPALQAFLADLQYRVGAKLTDFLRETVKVRCPVTAGSMWGSMNDGDFAGLMSWAAAGDFIDVHQYSRSNNEAANRLGLNISAETQKTWIGSIAGCRVQGSNGQRMPLTCTEFAPVQQTANPEPEADRAASLLLAASQMTLHDFDGAALFAWLQNPLSPDPRFEKLGCYDFANDPAIVATAPAAAILFRLEQIERLSPYVLNPTLEQVFGAFPPLAPSIDPNNGRRGPSTFPDACAAAERQPLLTVLPAHPALPWWSSSANAATVDSRVAEDDSCPLERDCGPSQACWQGSRVAWTAWTVDGSPAVAAACALDGHVIATARRILVSVLMKPEKTRASGWKVRCSVPTGKVRLRAAGRWTCRALTPQGNAEIPIERVGDSILFSTTPACLYLLEMTPPKE